MWFLAQLVCWSEGNVCAGDNWGSTVIRTKLFGADFYKVKMLCTKYKRWPEEAKGAACLRKLPLCLTWCEQQPVMEQSWSGWGWELPPGKGSVLESNWYNCNCSSEAIRALQGCNHLGFNQLLFVSNRLKLFWDNFFPQAVGYEFTLSSLGAWFAQREPALIAHIPGRRRCRWHTCKAGICTP